MSISALGGDKKIWAAIPVYNNHETLRKVVEGTLLVLDRVVVVDDGTTDAKVSELLSGLNITLLTHEKNRGKGSAILTASRHIEEQGGVYMITLDADGQHDPADISKFIPWLSGDDKKMIVGKRDFNTQNVPLGSRFGRRFANFWLRLEAGIYVDDCQSGFRAYPVKYLNQINLRRVNYDLEAEVLARFSWAGIEIKCVDIGVTYPPKGERVTHFRPFMDNFRLTLTHSMLIGRRLLPLPHKSVVPKERPDFRLLLSPVKLMRALLGENASPEGLAASAAIGILFATLPSLFLHTVIILYVATRLNLNKLMALNIQHICMPPFVPAICIEIGFYFRNDKWLMDLSYDTVFVQFGDRFLEWFIGSLIVGPVLAILAGTSVFFIALAVKKQKAVRA